MHDQKKKNLMKVVKGDNFFFFKYKISCQMTIQMFTEKKKKKKKKKGVLLSEQAVAMKNKSEE